MSIKIGFGFFAAALLLGGCVEMSKSGDRVPPVAEATLKPAFTMGNGERNSIVVDDVRIEGNTFTFSAAYIQDDGWLVLHPFKDGKPNGKIYAGASYIKKGANSEIAVSVEQPPESGTPFLVMLHSDVNKNGIFDFIFVDERNVIDRAVFEDNKMIAHIFKTP